MLQEKLNLTAMADYVFQKYKSNALTIADSGKQTSSASTHVIYEVSGDSIKTLTRVGEASTNKKNADDFIMTIYPHYSVSGELIMMKIEKT